MPLFEAEGGNGDTCLWMVHGLFCLWYLWFFSFLIFHLFLFLATPNMNFDSSSDIEKAEQSQAKPELGLTRSQIWSPEFYENSYISLWALNYRLKVIIFLVKTVIHNCDIVLWHVA